MANKDWGPRCPGQSWKLLSLVGVTFALAVTFQYIELPYASFWPSMSSAGKPIGQGLSSLVTDYPSSPPYPEVTHSLLNSTILHTADSDHASSQGSVVPTSANETYALENTSNPSSLQPAADNDDAVDGSDPEDGTENVDNGFLSQGITGFNKSSSGLQNHDNVGSLDQEDSVRTKGNSTLVLENSSAVAPAPAHTESSYSFTNVTIAPEAQGYSFFDIPPAVLLAPPPKDLSENVPLSETVEPNSPTVSVANTSQDINATSDKLQTDLNKAETESKPSPYKKAAEKRRKPDTTAPAVLPIWEMSRLMIQSWSSPNVIRPQWPSAADQELRHARSEIENAPIVTNDPMLYAPIYRNVSMFNRSYELMEKLLKVYVYREGERPVFHQPALKGIYASEGWFMKQLESYKKFVTRDSRKAHLFYLPFGSRNLEEALYVPNSHSHKNLIQYLKNYLDMVAAKYPFWNRTDGADHFLVACHDWAPAETRQYMSNCIRALCNADVKEGYVFGKDVSLPETYVHNPQKPLRDLGGQPPSKRSILAFYAGNMHGYVRPILLEHWQNKDPDMKIYGVMPKAKGNKNYIQHMRSSKYCICPKGYEVNSPRVVEAIFHECVPVIISDNFVPPFIEVLNWESFAVFVLEKDIPNLKNILLSISERRYLQMQMRVKRVQQHFLWHPRPAKYDVFHMVLHSIWYNRVFRT